MTADIDTLFSVLNTDMTSSAKLVYIALVYHANKNTLVAWPSRELLAKETSLDVKTVTRATNALVKNGFISKKKGQGGTKYSFEGALCPSPKGIKSFSKGHKVLSEGANTPTNIRKNIYNEHKHLTYSKNASSVCNMPEGFVLHNPDYVPNITRAN